jgi:hypothetical protein
MYSSAKRVFVACAILGYPVFCQVCWEDGGREEGGKRRDEGRGKKAEGGGRGKREEGWREEGGGSSEEGFVGYVFWGIHYFVKYVGGRE